MKNSTLRVKTETFVERANSWQEYYDIGHQLGEMGGLIRRMAMHMADLQKKVDRQATELKRQNIGWIPCSERLPVPNEYDETGKFFKAYLVQTKSNTMHTALWDGTYWTIWTRGIVIDKVIAWMPLPEPYKESED